MLVDGCGSSKCFKSLVEQKTGSISVSLLTSKSRDLSSPIWIRNSFQYSLLDFSSLECPWRRLRTTALYAEDHAHISSQSIGVVCLSSQWVSLPTVKYGQYNQTTGRYGPIVNMIYEGIGPTKHITAQSLLQAVSRVFWYD